MRVLRPPIRGSGREFPHDAFPASTNTSAGRRREARSRRPATGRPRSASSNGVPHVAIQNRRAATTSGDYPVRSPLVIVGGVRDGRRWQVVTEPAEATPRAYARTCGSIPPAPPAGASVQNTGGEVVVNADQAGGRNRSQSARQSRRIASGTAGPASRRPPPIRPRGTVSRLGARAARPCSTVRSPGWRGRGRVIQPPTTGPSGPGRAYLLDRHGASTPTGTRGPHRASCRPFI